jgi:hypothetical protein
LRELSVCVASGRHRVLDFHLHRHRCCGVCSGRRGIGREVGMCFGTAEGCSCGGRLFRRRRRQWWVRGVAVGARVGVEDIGGCVQEWGEGVEWVRGCMGGRGVGSVVKRGGRRGEGGRGLRSKRRTLGIAAGVNVDALLRRAFVGGEASGPRCRCAGVKVRLLEEISASTFKNMFIRSGDCAPSIITRIISGEKCTYPRTMETSILSTYRAMSSNIFDARRRPSRSRA